MCLANGLYDVFCIGLYNASSVAEGVRWQRRQFFILAFFNIAFIWFANEYTHQKSRKVSSALSLFFILSAIVKLVDRSKLTFQLDHPAIKGIFLPFGLKITYNEATLGSFTSIQGLMGLAVGIYVFWNVIRFYRQGHKREATPLIFALIILYAAAASDTAISDGVYHFI